MQNNSWDAVIVGAGPAGLSAALMLGRARRRVLVIDAGAPRNRFAAHMHGVLGHDGRTPSELRALGRDEAQRYEVEFVDAPVTEVDREESRLALSLSDGSLHYARAMIVATGVSDDLPPIPGLAERWGKSVLHCPYCHGWEFRDRRLAVLPTTEMSLHLAEIVRQWSDQLTVFTGIVGDISEEMVDRLHTRGVRIESSPVAEVLGSGDAVTGVLLEDGQHIGLDAVFTAGTLRPQDEFLAHLGLERSESPAGSVLAVDFSGRTSDERIWAVGNVVSPMANVPMSMGAGALTGGAVNGALTGWDVDELMADDTWPQISSRSFWEERYAESDRMWSSRVNAVLRDTASALSPGRALDVGCGEGADVVWLAQHGWDATGVDVSETAAQRARDAVSAQGLTAQVTTDDLSTVPEESFDLVTASFLHGPADLPREELLRRAAARVAPGGHLLITSHAGIPPWAAENAHAEHGRFPTPAEDLAKLDLDPDAWDTVTAETRTRDTIDPDGNPATIDDGVLLLRRR